MRPQITGGLEEEAKEQAEKRGFSSTGDLVRFALRKDLESHENND